MIGTRVDPVDAPRLIEGEGGWWFIGNRTWTLLRPDQVRPDGSLRPGADAFLHQAGAYDERTPQAYLLTVLTSTACNLGCGYCFQNTALDPTGGNMPLRIARDRLRPETITKIAGFAAERLAAAGMTDLDLLLFGGEPLLNPAGCLGLMDRLRPVGMRSASMVSNAVLLTERLAVKLAAAGLRSIQVTFDGSRDDHDGIRVRHDGGATFDTILDNVARATAATELVWTFRVNVSHHNQDRLGELVGQLAERVDPARCLLTYAWVGDAGFGYGNDLRRVDEVGDAFHAWSVAALEAGFRVARPSMRVTCQTCTRPGGGTGAVVNADGTLYSCWQSAGKPEMAVGTLDAGYRDPAEVPERWVSCGYEYEQGDPAAAARFQDRVDARLLDHLYASGRLGTLARQPVEPAAGRGTA